LENNQVKFIKTEPK